MCWTLQAPHASVSLVLVSSSGSFLGVDRPELQIWRSSDPVV